MTDNPLFRKAMIRSVLATLAIGLWVLAFDGPAWAWLMLIAYLMLTWTAAIALTRWVAKRQQQGPDA